MSVDWSQFKPVAPPADSSQQAAGAAVDWSQFKPVGQPTAPEPTPTSNPQGFGLYADPALDPRVVATKGLPGSAPVQTAPQSTAAPQSAPVDWSQFKPVEENPAPPIVVPKATFDAQGNPTSVTLQDAQGQPVGADAGAGPVAVIPKASFDAQGNPTSVTLTNPAGKPIGADAPKPDAPPVTPDFQKDMDEKGIAQAVADQYGPFLKSGYYSMVADVDRPFVMAAGALAMMGDKATSLIVGKPVTSAQQAIFGKVMAPIDATAGAAAAQVPQNQHIDQKIVGDVPGILSTIAQAYVTGGESTAENVGLKLPEYTQKVGEFTRQALRKALPGMSAPAMEAGVDTIDKNVKQGVDLNTSVEQGIASALQTEMMGVIPLNGPGGKGAVAMVKRMATGAATMPAFTELGRRIANAIYGAQYADKQQGYDPAETISSAIEGAGFGLLPHDQTHGATDFRSPEEKAESAAQAIKDKVDALNQERDQQAKATSDNLAPEHKDLLNRSLADVEQKIPQATGAELAELQQRRVALKEALGTEGENGEAAAPRPRTISEARGEKPITTYEAAMDKINNDPITGLKTRAWFDNEPLQSHVLLGDMDGLKSVNDAYGHDAGDQLLKAAGAAWKQAQAETPGAPQVARWGGDEFGAHGDADTLKALADKANGILGQQQFEFVHPDGTVTRESGFGFSYGIAQPGVGEHALKPADAILKQHKAKRAAEGARVRPDQVAGANAAPAAAGDEGVPGGTGRPADTGGAEAPAPVGESQAAPGEAEPALTPAEEAASAAANEKKLKASQAAKARALKAQNQPVDPTKDHLLAAIAKSGGLNSDEAKSVYGFDPADMRMAFGHGLKRVFTKNGMKADQMAELMHEHGYPVQDEKGNYDPRVLMEQVEDSLRGKKVYSTHAADMVAQSAAEAHEQALKDAEADRASGYHAPDYEFGTGQDRPDSEYPPDSGYPGDVTPQMRVARDMADKAMQVDPDAAEPVMERWGKDAITTVEAVREFEAIINARSESHGQETEVPGEAGSVPDAGTAGLGDQERQEETPAADAARQPGFALAQESAPQAGGPRRATQQDMLGGATETQQALHREQLKRDEARNSGQESAETGDAGDMFSKAKDQNGLKFRLKEGEDEKAPTFYSRMQKDLEEKLPGSGTAESMLQQINARARNGGFKQEELDWSGVKDWLREQKGKVTKEQVLDFLRANNIQVQEVDHHGHNPISQEEIEDAEARGDFDEAERLTRIYEDQQLGNNANDTGNETKYSRYQTPGGHDYHELLLTLPRKGGKDNFVVREQAGAASIWDVANNERVMNGLPPDAARTEARRLNEDIDRSNFRSNHFGEPNVLAHVRFNSRTDADGKKVLHIEEVQSDWHQKGRREGYRQSELGKIPRLDEFKVDQSEHQYHVTAPDGWKVDIGKGTVDSEAEAREYAQRHYANTAKEKRVENSTRVPDAPFKTTWPMLAMKRMIRYAAEHGYDRLTWTTGDQQADRYDLSKKISHIEVVPRTDAVTDEKSRVVYLHTPDQARGGEWTHTIQLGVGNDGVVDNAPRATDYKGKHLSDVVGKELSDKIMQTTGKATFRDNDLRVGGEGMRAFYDKMLPNEVNKYVKKWGGKVGATEIDASQEYYKRFELINPHGKTAGQYETRAEAEEAANSRIQRGSGNWKPGESWGVRDTGAVKPTKVHSLDITPAMRADVTEKGQPLFSLNRLAPRGREGQAKADAEKAIAPLRKQWGKGAPRIVVHQGESDLPGHHQDEIKAAGASGRVEGFYDPDTHTVHLIADNLKTPGDVVRTLLHEVRGHARLRDVFGRDVEPILNRVLNAYGKKGLQDIVDHYGLDWDNRDDRLTAAEEKIAKIAETGENPSLLQHVIAFVRGHLRKLFPDMKFSDAEIHQLVHDMNRGLDRPETVRQIGEPAHAGARFSLRGPQAYKDFQTLKGTAVDRAHEAAKQKVSEGIHAIGDILEKHTPDPVHDFFGALHKKLGYVGNELDKSLKPLDAGNEDTAALAKRYANSEAETKLRVLDSMDKLVKDFTPEQRQRIWEATSAESVAKVTGIEAKGGFDTLSPKEREAAIQLQKDNDPIADEAVRLGILKHRYQIYDPRFLAGIAQDHGGSNVLNPMGHDIRLTTPHALAREHLTADESEKAAQALYGDKAHLIRDARILPFAGYQLQRIINAHKLIRAIDEYGQGRGERLVLSGDEAPGHEHKGYKSIDNPAFTYAGKQAGLFASPKLWIHPDLEGPLRAVLTKSDHGIIVRSALSLKSKAMATIVGAFPPIHRSTVFFKTAVTYPMSMFSGRLQAMGKDLRLSNSEEKYQAARDGLRDVSRRGWVGTVEDLDTEPRIDDKVGQSWTAQMLGAGARVAGMPAGKGKEWQQTVKEAVDDAGHFWHSTLMWEKVANTQYGLYRMVKADLVKRGMEEDGAGKVAAQVANRFVGAIAKEDMSEAARTVLNLTLFSRSFTMSNLGLYKDALGSGLPKAVVGQISAADKALANNFYRRKAAAALIKDIAALTVTNAALQSAIAYWTKQETGDQIVDGYKKRFAEYVAAGMQNPLHFLTGIGDISPTSKNEPGKEDYIYLGRNAQGTGMYLKNPFGKVGFDLLHWLTSPLQELGRKESTIAGPVIKVLSNDKGYGRQIYSPQDAWQDEVMDVAKYLINENTPSQLIHGAYDAVTGKDRSTSNLAQSALSPFGLFVSHGAPGGPPEGFMYAAEKQHDFDKQQALPDIRKAILNGDDATAVRGMLDAHMTAQEIRSTIENTLAPGKSLDKQRIMKVAQYMTPEQRQAFMDSFRQQ